MAVFPADAADYETLINNAALARLRAKADRIDHVCRYEHSMDEGARARRKLASELRVAISRGELELFYQPQASVVDRATKGFEALARWNHPQLGFVPPSEFIAIAEESGLIESLGEWVLRTACATAATWEPPLRIAVNVSPLQLARGDLSGLVVDVLERTGLPAHRLELELTESAVVKDPKRSLQMLRKIKALGVSLALDDFGSGHSSLSTLRLFPFDKIKLDRSFMGEIETSKEARAVLKAVLALGRGLGIPVLAEGIETEGQFDRLREEGCDQVQGYLLGRPARIAHWIGEGLLRVKPALPLTRANAA
jgi:EAL domain-containing protein (putative c-di-GMP-specific phosphodiesterase class I)